MHRYLLFTYYAGRPLGGMNDFLDAFRTPGEALESLLDEDGRYFQLVDGETLTVIRQGLTRFKDYSPRAFRREP